MTNPQEDFFNRIDEIVMPQLDRAFKGGLEQGISTTLEVLFKIGYITREQAETARAKLTEQHREMLPKVFQEAKLRARRDVRSDLN